MKLMICSRTGLLWSSEGEYALDWIRTQHGPFDELVHVGDSDIDESAENYAGAHGIPTRIMEPDYARFGRRAPLERNGAMAEYVGPDGVCMAFTTSSGLHDGLLRAIAVGMTCYRFDAENGILTRLEGKLFQPVDLEG